jgi:predicted branched-subunit amino acid permease
LLSIYAVLFIPVAVFSFVAGLRLWLVKPGAINFTKRFLWTYLSANIGYFVIWVLWTLIAQPSSPVSFADMVWGHVVGPILFVALWYSYLERSRRVRDTYVS